MELDHPTDAAARRRRAALAGHQGDVDGARALARDEDPSVRATAVGALGRLGALTADDVQRGLADADPGVRRRTCEAAAAVLEVDLRSMLADTHPSVVEAAAWALGERGTHAADAVGDLVGVARHNDEPLCREAAVAALGAIGDRRGLAAVLDGAASDRPAVRRRAVVALAAFDGPEVEAALRHALTDRDWQVRQAAEDLLSE
jgi:HEAT repeat protein